MILNVTKCLAIDRQVRNWCKLSYYGHPKGCPNWNQSENCPPKVGFVTDIFNLKQTHWFIFVTFNLLQHVEKMKKLHPHWSDKQCRCCLYWQGSIKKKLKIACENFIRSNSKNQIYTLIPEAMGVNVFKTLHRKKIMIRKNPQDIVYKVALIGERQHGQRL